jgi:D-aspartate ligase
MTSPSFSLGGLHPERPPVVLLGDISVIRPLAMAKIPVLLIAADPASPSLRSRHVSAHAIVPGIDDPDQKGPVASLLELGDTLRGALGRKVPLFYSSDKHLKLIYRNRRAIEDRYLVLLNDDDTAWSLHDKDRFHRLTRRAGILSPKTLRSGDDIDRRLHELREPILVKPKCKASWKTIQRDLFEGSGKARVFQTCAELAAHPGFRRHRDDVLVQEYIPGGVECLVSFHGLCDRGGRLLGSFCGRKIRTVPRIAGESCFIELVKDRTIDRAGRSIVEKLGLKGPFKIDFVRDPRTGELYTLEINARFNLWNHLGAAHGVNLPRIAYEYLVYGLSPDHEPPYAPRYRWLHLYGDYHSFREGRAAVELGLGSWLASIANPSNLHDIFAWDDPAPFVHWFKSFVGPKLGQRRSTQRPV